MAKQPAYRRVPALRTFLKANQRAVVDKLAGEAGTTRAYLTQIAYGHRQPSWKLALRLERVIPGVSTELLRPDIFGAAPSRDTTAA